MNTSHSRRLSLLAQALMVLASSELCAANTLTITPVVDSTVSGYAGETQQVQYNVASRGNQALVFSMRPLFGVQQLIEGQHTCQLKMTLKPGESCTLILEVDVSKAARLKAGNPQLCTDDFCAQPALGNSLKIAVLADDLAPLSAQIELSPEASFAAGHSFCFTSNFACGLSLIAGGNPGYLQITKSS